MRWNVDTCAQMVRGILTLTVSVRGKPTKLSCVLCGVRSMSWASAELSMSGNACVCADCSPCERQFRALRLPLAQNDISERIVLRCMSSAWQTTNAEKPRSTNHYRTRWLTAVEGFATLCYCAGRPCLQPSSWIVTCASVPAIGGWYVGTKAVTGRCAGMKDLVVGTK